jgi:hypothetical protein
MNLNLSLSPQMPANITAVIQAAWGRVRHELMYISWALMEVALITPITLSFMGWARYWPPGQVALWLLLVMLLPLNLVRLLSQLGVPRRRQQHAFLLALPLVILIANGALVYQNWNIFNLSWVRLFFAHLAERDNQLWTRDVGVMLLTIIVWGRGTALMNRRFRVNKIGLFLRIGGLILAPFIIWLGYIRLQWGIAPFLLLFFAAGLTAVSLTRAEEIEQLRSGQSAYLSPRWVSSILTTILLIIFTAGILAAIISGESAYQLVGWMAPIWTAISFASTVVIIAFTYVALPLLALLGQLVAGFSYIFNLIFRRFDFSGQQAQGEFFEGQIVTMADLAELARNMPMLGKIIVFAIILGIVLLVTIVLIHLRRAKMALWDSQRIGRDPHAQRGNLDIVEKILQKMGFWRDWYAAASIRRVYQHMSHAATVSGQPRTESETPYEYLVSLHRVWPQHHAECALITDAFVKVRYGELPETADDLNAILTAWQRLQETEPMTLKTN